MGQELLLGRSCLLLLYDSVGSVPFRHTLRDDLVVRAASVYFLVILLLLVVFADNARVQGVRRVDHDVIHLPVLENFVESESSAIMSSTPAASTPAASAPATRAALGGGAFSVVIVPPASVVCTQGCVGVGTALCVCGRSSKCRRECCENCECCNDVLIHGGEVFSLLIFRMTEIAQKSHSLVTPLAKPVSTSIARHSREKASITLSVACICAHQRTASATGQWYHSGR